MKVRRSHPQAAARFVADTSFGGDLRKRPIAIVVIEYIGGCLIIGRHTDVRLTVRPLARIVAFDAPFTIAADKQVQETIAIVIEPDGACRESLEPDAGFCRHIFECAVTPVPKQLVLSITTDIEIGMPIVIIVADSSGDAIVRLDATESVRLECKAAASIVDIQTMVQRLFIPALTYSQRFGLWEIDVQKPISVGIE